MKKRILSLRRVLSMVIAAAMTISMASTLMTATASGQDTTVGVMTDILPAYQSGGMYSEISQLKSGGADSFKLAGVTYKNGLVFGDKRGENWAVYNLDGDFSKFTAYLRHVDGTENNPATVQVFFDGVLQNNLSFSLESYMPTAFVEWELTGVKHLRIVVDIEVGHTKYAFGNPVLTFADGKESHVIPTLAENERYMTDIVPAYQSGGNKYYEISQFGGGNGESFSLAGMTYGNGLIFGGERRGEIWSVYNLEGRFTKFVASLRHIDGIVSDEAEVNVFFDGVLQNNLRLLLATDLPTLSVEWNLTGVRHLRIVITTSRNYSTYAFANPILTFSEDEPLPFVVTSNNSKRDYVYAGTTVGIIAKEIHGKEFDRWTSDTSDVVFENGENAVTTFVMPAKNISITADYIDVDFILGNVTGSGTVSISDAVQILCYLAELPSFLDSGVGSASWNAALITPASKTKGIPTIQDAVQILCYLAELPSELL